MWKDKKIIRKAKVITIPTNTVFKLSDYTQGIAWGDHILKTGIIIEINIFSPYTPA